MLCRIPSLGLGTVYLRFESACDNYRRNGTTQHNTCNAQRAHGFMPGIIHHRAVRASQNANRTTDMTECHKIVVLRTIQLKQTALLDVKQCRWTNTCAFVRAHATSQTTDVIRTHERCRQRGASLNRFIGRFKFVQAGTAAVHHQHRVLDRDGPVRVFTCPS